MKNYFLVLLASLIFALISCGDNPTEPSKSNEFMPLKMGNYWKYEVMENDGNNNFKLYSNILLEIRNDTVISNKKFYKVELTNDTIKGYSYYSLQPDGFYNVNFIYDYKNNDFIFYPVRSIKLPINLGDSYLNDMNILIKVTSTNTIITTKAGKFTCIVIEQYENSGFIRDYYCYGVGIIKSEIFENNNAKSVLVGTLELTEYKIN